MLVMGGSKSSSRLTVDGCTPIDIETKSDGSPKPHYHAGTRPIDGRVSLLIDPGSTGNLAGGKWALQTAQAAFNRGKEHLLKQNQRVKPLQVMGVGHGSQMCTFDCTIPIALSEKTEWSLASSQRQ